MKHSPIYQTLSTRCFYPRRSRPRILLLLGGVVGIVLIALVLGRGLPLQARSDAAAAPSAVALQAGQPGIIPRTPVALAPLATGASSSTQQFHVSGTGGQGVYLRARPSSDAIAIEMLQDGSLVTVIGTDVAGQDHTWRPVMDGHGTRGWVASEYLQATG